MLWESQFGKYWFFPIYMIIKFMFQIYWFFILEVEKVKKYFNIFGFPIFWESQFGKISIELKHVFKSRLTSDNLPRIFHFAEEKYFETVEIKVTNHREWN